MDRAPGLSVRLKLTLSYAGFLMLAGALLLGAVWVFLLRYVPRGEPVIVHAGTPIHSPFPIRSQPPARFRSKAAAVSVGVPAGIRSPRRVVSRRPDARPADADHRRHAHRRDRVALPPDPATRAHG